MVIHVQESSIFASKMVLAFEAGSCAVCENGKPVKKHSKMRNKTTALQEL